MTICPGGPASWVARCPITVFAEGRISVANTKRRAGGYRLFMMRFNVSGAGWLGPQDGITNTRACAAASKISLASPMVPCWLTTRTSTGPTTEATAPSGAVQAGKPGSDAPGKSPPVK